jgi:hypothetical protein
MNIRVIFVIVIMDEQNIASIQQHDEKNTPSMGKRSKQLGLEDLTPERTQVSTSTTK